MAATASPEIKVYAPLPRVVMLGGNLNLDPTNWRWVHCLTLPVKTLNTLRFSRRPYKWIRYAIGIVIGAEGDLSSSPSPPDSIDYSAGLPNESGVLYYHTSDEERRRMSIDPDLARARITESFPTSRRAHFPSEVAERDGWMCVLYPGMTAEFCDAVHLLPHSKGDEYIANYTRRRSRDPSGGDIIESIDSIRNGLLLNKMSRVSLGTDVGFLMTPNFAMTTADVDPSASPTEKRCTGHSFKPGRLSLAGNTGGPPSGAPVRLSDTAFPPSIIFDAVYAGAVVFHFGTEKLREASTLWRNAFAPSGVRTAANTEYKAIIGQRVATETKTEDEAPERQTRYEARSDLFDMLMGIPYLLVPPEDLQRVVREAEERAAAAEQRRVKEKVETWMKQITPSPA